MRAISPKYCLICRNSTEDDKEKIMIAVENPYGNFYFHTDCVEDYKELPNIIGKWLKSTYSNEK